MVGEKSGKDSAESNDHRGASDTVTHSQQRGELFARPDMRTDIGVSKKKNEQDAGLDAVSHNLAELHDISVMMGESLDAHNSKLDTIVSKTDKVNDTTLEVLLKSSQLIDRNSSVKPVFLGEFCFELHTGGYLSVQDEMLVIGPPIADLSTSFRCFKKGDIFALLCSRTMKFLATGYFTPVSVSGMQFNKATHMFLDLSGEFSGILMLSTNWGSGGWIKRNITVQGPFFWHETFKL